MGVRRALSALVATVTATAVFAAPAMAQETIHFLNGGPIGGGGVTVHYTGTFDFMNESGGIDCKEGTAKVTFTTFTAYITAFNMTCKTTGLLKEAFGCELQSPTAPEALNLPWTIEPLSTSTAVVQGTDINMPLKPGCGIESIEASGNGVHITTKEAGVLEHLTLSGELESTLGPVAVEGTLTATPGEPNITEVST